MLAARYARVCPGNRAPKQKGAGKAGCSPHPRPRVGIKEPHELIHHRLRRIIRPSLRNGFNGFLRALPGDRAFLPPSPARTLQTWRQHRGARTTRLRRPRTTSFVVVTCRVHRIPHPTFVTIAKRPSYRGRTAWRSKGVSTGPRSEIFLQGPLDRGIAHAARRANHLGPQGTIKTVAASPRSMSMSPPPIA